MPISEPSAAQIIIPCKICTAAIHWLSSNQNKYFFLQPEYLLCNQLSSIYFNKTITNLKKNRNNYYSGQQVTVESAVKCYKSKPIHIMGNLLEFQIHGILIMGHQKSIYIYTYIIYIIKMGCKYVVIRTVSWRSYHTLWMNHLRPRWRSILRFMFWNDSCCINWIWWEEFYRSPKLDLHNSFTLKLLYSEIAFLY